MKISLLNTVGAMALTGLAFALTPSTLSAHERGGNSWGRGESHYSSRGHMERSCSRLPHGCRPVRYRGERCWFGGGNYYRCNPVGGYVIVEQPQVEYRETVMERPAVKHIVKKVVEKEVEEQPAVEEQQAVEQQAVEQPAVEEATEQPATEEAVEQPAVEKQVVEQPAYEQEQEQEEVVTALPKKSTTVYVQGERCWYNNGCYYRHFAHGYRKCFYRNHCFVSTHCSRHYAPVCHSSHECHSHISRCSSRSSHCHSSSHSTRCSSGHRR